MAKVLIAFTVLMLASAQLQWGYNKGGDDWTGTCAAGLAQSPVNITDADDAPDHYGDLKFNYEAVEAGHYVSGFNFAYLVGGLNGELTAPVANTTEEKKTFFAQGILVHSPSEHRRNGKQYDLELQIFHTLSQNDTYPYTGETASIAVLIKEGDHNKFLQQIIDANVTIDLNDLFKDGKIDEYYAYEGSFTVPPCAEKVNWYIWDNIKHASKEQIKFFTSHFQDNSDFANGHGNNRNAQDLGTRDLYHYSDFAAQIVAMLFLSIFA